MRPSTAAALVGAAVLSTLIFPILGERLRRGRVAVPASAGEAVAEGAELEVSQ